VVDVREPPAGLSKRARDFVRFHGIWLDAPPVGQARRRWQEDGIPAEVIDRADRFQARWGGLALPSAPGLPAAAAGPLMLCVDTPDREGAFPSPGWYFAAGPQRCAVPYAFLIGPDGTFGIADDEDRWVPLHASIEGWIESLALTYAAATIAGTITRLTGRAVDEIDLTTMQPVMEVNGINTGWWYRPGQLAALYAGEADLFDRPGHRTAFLYTGNIDLQWV
jgi:hypothetical protein